MDDEQEITMNVLEDISTKLQLREEVSPRLIFRALSWAKQEIEKQNRKLEAVKSAIQEES